MINQITIDSDNIVTACSIGGLIEGGIDVNNIPNDVLYNSSKYRYIDGEFILREDMLNDVINVKCSEINSACELAILNGFELDGSHYSMTSNDQSNLISLTPMAQAGKSVPYHADGEECRLYSADEFMAVVMRATGFKTHHITYCNLLKMQVKDMTNVQDINSVKYDNTPLNSEYQTRYNEIMGALMNG